MRHSYSQFGEDSCVAAYFEKKAFAKYRDKTKIEPGFFIDIGCYQPIELSNTYLFYLLGWRGVNIDATPGVKERFDAERPEDTNIWCLVSNEVSDLTFYTWGNSVYNTASKEIADRLVRDGRVSKPPVEVTPPTRSLSEIIAEHRPSGAIQLLNVDAEGCDLQVLASNDWTKYRPEVVLVEEHEGLISNVVNSLVYKFMIDKGYRLYAWLPPTLMFVRS